MGIKKSFWRKVGRIFLGAAVEAATEKLDEPARPNEQRQQPDDRG